MSKGNGMNKKGTSAEDLVKMIVSVMVPLVFLLGALSMAWTMISPLVDECLVAQTTAYDISAISGVAYSIPGKSTFLYRGIPQCDVKNGVMTCLDDRIIIPSGEIQVVKEAGTGGDEYSKVGLNSFFPRADWVQETCGGENCEFTFKFLKDEFDKEPNFNPSSSEGSFIVKKTPTSYGDKLMGDEPSSSDRKDMVSLVVEESLGFCDKFRQEKWGLTGGESLANETLSVRIPEGFVFGHDSSKERIYINESYKYGQYMITSFDFDDDITGGANCQFYLDGTSTNSYAGDATFNVTFTYKNTTTSQKPYLNISFEKI